MHSGGTLHHCPGKQIPNITTIDDASVNLPYPALNIVHDVDDIPANREPNRAVDVGLRCKQPVAVVATVAHAGKCGNGAAAIDGPDAVVAGIPEVKVALGIKRQAHGHAQFGTGGRASVAGKAARSGTGSG